MCMQTLSSVFAVLVQLRHIYMLSLCFNSVVIMSCQQHLLSGHIDRCWPAVHELNQTCLVSLLQPWKVSVCCGPVHCLV